MLHPDFFYAMEATSRNSLKRNGTNRAVKRLITRNFSVIGLPMDSRSNCVLEIATQIDAPKNLPDQEGAAAPQLCPHAYGFWRLGLAPPGGLLIGGVCGASQFLLFELSHDFALLMSARVFT